MDIKERADGQEQAIMMGQINIYLEIMYIRIIYYIENYCMLYGIVFLN